MKTILTLLIIFCCNLLHAQDFHLVILADTTDAKIRPAVKVNTDRLKRQLGNLTEGLRLNLIVDELKSSDISFEAVDSFIDHLEFGAEDVVFFHYSGHGANSGSSHWPKFLIKDPQNRATLLYFNAKLMSKSPRLLISMADCCNIGQGPGSVGAAFHTPKAKSRRVPKGAGNLHRLFLESSGNLICSSSQTGQYSYYEDDLGGYYTASFFWALFQAGEASSPLNWDTLMKRVGQHTEEMTGEVGRSQNPQHVWRRPNAENTAGNGVASAINCLHQVKKDETLWGLSRQYEVTVGQIKKWNQLINDDIRTGQVLKLCPK